MFYLLSSAKYWKSQTFLFLFWIGVSSMTGFLYWRYCIVELRLTSILNHSLRKFNLFLCRCEKQSSSAFPLPSPASQRNRRHAEFHFELIYKKFPNKNLIANFDRRRDESATVSSSFIILTRTILPFKPFRAIFKAARSYSSWCTKTFCCGSHYFWCHNWNFLQLWTEQNVFNEGQEQTDRAASFKGPLMQPVFF